MAGRTMRRQDRQMNEHEHGARTEPHNKRTKTAAAQRRHGLPASTAQPRKKKQWVEA